VAGVALLLAVVVRVAFLAGKPFWRDEAWVAWVVELPARPLASLGYAVPVGFVAIVKGLGVLLPGPPEITYRLLPLAAGLASVALMPVLARALGASTPVALASLWLAAGLPALVYYSRELKAYSLDLLFAVLVPLLAVRAVGAAGSSRPAARLGALAAVLVVAPWLSFGAVFVIAAVFAWAAVHLIRQRGWRNAPRWLGPALLGAASLAVLYVTFLRRQATSWFLLEMWREELPSGPGLPSAAVLARAVWDVHRVALEYFFPQVWPVAAVLVATGLLAWPRTGRAQILWAWLGAGALAAGAALAGLYLTTHGRFVLFLAPPLVLLASAGLVRAGEWMGRPSIAVALAAMASLWWSGQAIAHRVRAEPSDPRRYFLHDVIHEVDPLIARLSEAGVPAHAVMVSRYAADPFRYYSRGRLAGAFVPAVLDRDFAAAVDRWRTTQEGEGWLILLDEEAQGGRRVALNEKGLAVQEVAATRGGLLWRVRPMAP
jgi:hypothetical protein